MVYEPKKAQEARERYLSQQTEPSEPETVQDQPQFTQQAVRPSLWKRMAGGLGNQMGRIKWWYVLAGLTILGAIFWFFTNPPSIEPNLNGISFSGPGEANLSVGFLELAFLITILYGFIEASDRKDPLLMDWWLPYVVWGAMIYAAKQPALTFGLGALVFLPLGILVLAAFWNRGEEYEEGWWERFDTTGIFALCFVLVLTHLAEWSSLPYPDFVPIALVYIVGVFALFKELLRSFLFGVTVVLLGIAAGFFMTWTAIAITFALTIVAVYAGAWQQKIPVSGARRSWSQQSFGGFQYKLIKAWDVMAAWWAAFVLTAMSFYGNFPLVTLSS